MKQKIPPEDKGGHFMANHEESSPVERQKNHLTDEDSPNWGRITWRMEKVLSEEGNH